VHEAADHKAVSNLQFPMEQEKTLEFFSRTNTSLKQVVEVKFLIETKRYCIILEEIL
jgi:hypothetical protein